MSKAIEFKPIHYKHPLALETGVIEYLRHYHHLRAEALATANYDALARVIDIENALAGARLTADEEEAIQLVYVQGITNREVAKALGITQQAISNRCRKAVTKISEYYRTTIK